VCVHYSRVHSSVPSCGRFVSYPSSILNVSNRASFFLLGYGAAVNLALNNVYCANTHPPSVILGLAHGSYGVGGIIAPIVGTALVSHGVLWSRFYFLAVGLRICCIVFAGSAFWSYREDSEPTLLTALEATSSRQTAAEDAASKFKELKVALKNKVTIFGALFIFAYQGAEVAISGWIISYLINYRDGDPSKVGYVTAGFWVRFRELNCCSIDIANTVSGRYHTWSLRAHTCRAQDWREELRSHTHPWHICTATARLADSQHHWQRCCSLSLGPPTRTRLPLRANHLLAPFAPEHSNNRYWLHWRCRKLGRCCCSLYHGYTCASHRYLGASPRLFGYVCGNDGVLVRST
jgi:hypothetical protein